MAVNSLNISTFGSNNYYTARSSAMIPRIPYNQFNKSVSNISRTTSYVPPPPGISTSNSNPKPVTPVNDDNNVPGPPKTPSKNNKPNDIPVPPGTPSKDNIPGPPGTPGSQKQPSSPNSLHNIPGPPGSPSNHNTTSFIPGPPKPSSPNNSNIPGPPQSPSKNNTSNKNGLIPGPPIEFNGKSISANSENQFIEELSTEIMQNDDDKKFVNNVLNK